MPQTQECWPIFFGSCGMLGRPIKKFHPGDSGKAWLLAMTLELWIEKSHFFGSKWSFFSFCAHKVRPVRLNLGRLIACRSPLYETTILSGNLVRDFSRDQKVEIFGPFWMEKWAFLLIFHESSRLEGWHLLTQKAVAACLALKLTQSMRWPSNRRLGASGQRLEKVEISPLFFLCFLPTRKVCFDFLKSREI